MTASYKTGTFTKTSGTGSQSITGVGFQPKALIVYTTGNTTVNTITTHHVLSYGISDGTNTKCAALTSQDAVSTTKSRRIADSDSIVNIRNVGSPAGATVVGDLTSLDSDGFTINWTTGAIDPVFGYIAFAGDDLTAEVGSFTTPVAMGTLNVSTGLDTGNFLMLVSPATTPEDSVISDASISLGVTDGTNQGVLSIGCDDAVATTNTHRYQRTNNIFASLDSSAGTVEEEAAFDGFTSSGFDLDFTTADGTARDVYYLELKGAKWEVGSGTTPTTATTQAYTTTFEPKGLGLFSKNNTATTNVQTDSYFNFGAADGTDETCAAIHENDAVGTSDAARNQLNAKCYYNFNSTTVTLEEATLDSFNATDFTLDFSKAHSSTREFLWFVMGDEDEVVATEDGGGAGPAGSSKQVGVSLVDKQIREIVPPKRRLSFEAAFRVSSQIATPLELPVKVSSELQADSQSLLIVKSSMKVTPSATLNLKVTPLAVMSNRFEVQGSIKQALTAGVGVEGQRYLDIDNVDMIPSELAVELMKQKAFREFYE